MLHVLLALVLLLCLPQAGHATTFFIAGAETGDNSEFPIGAGAGTTADTGTVKTGAYSYKMVKTNCPTTQTGLNSSTIYTRFYWRALDTFTSPNYVSGATPSTGTNQFLLIADTALGNKLKFCFAANLTGCTTIASGATTLVEDTWFLFEVKMVVSATVGGMEVKLNGTTEFSSFGSNTGTSNINYAFFGPCDASVFATTWFFDDIIVGNDGYFGAGQNIARQGTSGSPTYTAWTKNSCTGGTIDGCWSETPFTATTPSASSTVLNDAQTMVVHDFATTQTGHGTETIGNTSTINACKTAMVANAASGGTLTMRRRSGSDTDTAKTITTGNLYYDDGIWTTTPDILRNQTIEIGAKQGANTVTQTIRDMWLMCDFANASQAPKHRVIQQ